MILVAHLATAGGVRAPLARVANQVFADLSEQLSAQGVAKTVGNLGCNDINCSDPRRCPEGTTAGTTCVACGPIACSVTRTGCLQNCATSPNARSGTATPAPTLACARAASSAAQFGASRTYAIVR